jgi:YaiO family outer membrane protein
MRFTVLLAMLLTVSASAQEAPAPLVPSFDDAIRLANENNNDAALAAFQRRAAADPTDHASRLWIARLHERMRRTRLAEPVYRSVLLEDPSNLDARLGVASMLLRRYAAEEAIKVLEPAEGSARENAGTLVLLGRAHRMAGNDARAIEYFERAVAIDPSPAYRNHLETARLAYSHRIETRGLSEQFNQGVPDGRGGHAAISYRLNDEVRVLGRFEAQRKFGATDQRGGGGVEWRWTPATTLRGQVLVGPDNDVIPEGDYLGEIDHTRGSATWTGGVRHFSFRGAHTTVFSPSVAWLTSDRLLVGLRYAMSWTEMNDQSAKDLGHSAHVAADYRLHYRLWIRGGYAAGVESFETFSIDRIGDFRANMISAGVRIPLPTLTTITGTYEHQRREQDVTMGRFTVLLQHGF